MDKYYLLVDLDGTLADCTERAKKFLAGENPDWDGFYGACGDDKPITAVIRIIENLSRSYDIVMCTGRRQSCDKDTREWLNKFAPEIANFPILYRKDGDYRHDVIVKPEMLNDYMKANHKKKPFAIFEDRNSMVAKWRELGYTVFQPADGDF